MHVRATRASLISFLLLLTFGCDTEGLSFREDRRVQIVQPEQRSEVMLPVVLEWTVHDFDITGADGSATSSRGLFAVFIDTTPQPPTESLAWFARDDETCRQSPDCPDEAYLRDKGVIRTTETSLSIDFLPPRLDAPRGQEDIHEITVVLLDGQERRIGETSATVTIELVRDDVSN